LLGLFFNPEGGADMFHRNFGVLSTDYTGLMSWKRELFITNSGRTSDPTYEVLTIKNNTHNIYCVCNDNTDIAELICDFINMNTSIVAMLFP
jgi:hypothetical protein